MRKIFLLLFGFLALGSGCDTIDEANRVVEMDKVIPQKNILMMDFTDQLCINCPEASMLTDSMQNSYGNALIVVSVHSSRSALTLVTNEGKEYDQHFGINYTHPNAVIDGLDVYQKDLWGGAVLDRFNVFSQVTLELTADYDEATHKIDITSLISHAAPLSGTFKYQLWITEDSIVDYQKINSKDYDYDYVHNHVFRTSVNGTWGEEISLSDEKEIKTLRHAFSVTNDKWRPFHLSVVGFIYNASSSSDEVYEVKQTHISDQIE
jgi:hypothetical protein